VSEQDQKGIWERQEGETLLWYRRFERFRLMEPVRKIALVFQEEQQTEENRGKQRNEPPGVWYEIAKQWRWEDRAAAWDAYRDEQIETQIVAERKKVLKSRFALMHKRVELLDRKIQQLVEITDSESGVWLPDVKSVGTGPGAERVDLVQFNSDAFKELREYLDDIAAELGERVKKTDATVNLIPKTYLDLDQDEDGSEP
jgi:hypothetical protein